MHRRGHRADGLAGACGTESSSPPAGGGWDLSGARPADFEAHGSVGQAWLVDAGPGRSIDLTDASGRVLRSAAADEHGSLLLRDLAPGVYRVVSGGGPDGLPTLGSGRAVWPLYSPPQDA